jgi:hypothetical protein
VAGRGTLPGLVRGLRGYLMFCLSVAALGTPLGVLVGLALAVAQSFMPRNSVRPGGLGSTAKPTLA